jgi:hypothetical protein
MAQMCISEGPTCSSWESYTTAKSWSLAGGDGEKAVYARYRDHLNNSSAVLSDTVFLDTASPVVTVTAPSQTSDLTFTVSWGALDPEPHSGVVSYTVAYREDAGVWATWFASTTLTQAAFVSGSLNHTYVFSVTAYDYAGNRGEGAVTTRVGYHYVYLPLVMKSWVWWYRYDIYEPNDTPAQAYGPLVSAQVYAAYIWDTTDQNDYYHFTPSTTGVVQISLSNIPANCDYDLYVYYYDGQYRQEAYSNESGNKDESVTFTPVAGRKYYIRIYRYSGFSSQQAYHLEAIYQ